jgi:integrase
MSKGSVYRRGTTWTAHASWGSGDSKRQAKKGGYRTKKEAEKALADLLSTVNTGTFVTPSKLTVADYLDRWLAGLVTAGRRPSTIDGYRRNLDAYVKNRIGRVPLQDLGAVDLDQLYSTLATKGRRDGTPLSLRTVRYTHSIIGKALADAERKQLVARNAARLASPPRTSATRAPEMSTWTPGELRHFLDQVAGHYYGPLVRAAAMTGMRRAELLGLRWADVDLDGGSVVVRQSVQQVAGRIVVGDVKTARSRRRLDLDPVTVAVLRSHRVAQWKRRAQVGAGWKNHDLVFNAPDGSPLKPDSITQWFERAVQRSGLPRIRLHDLRHSHATHLLAAGTNPKVVSERLGHASVAFTLDTYGHVMPGQQAAAAAAAAALVDEPATKRLPAAR